MVIHAKLKMIAIDTSIPLQIKHHLRTIKGHYFLQTEVNSLKSTVSRPVLISRQETSSSLKLLLCSSRAHRFCTMTATALGDPGWHCAACKLPWKNLLMGGCFLFPSRTLRHRMKNFPTTCQRLRKKNPFDIRPECSFQQLVTAIHGHASDLTEKE